VQGIHLSRAYEEEPTTFDPSASTDPHIDPGRGRRYGPVSTSGPRVYGSGSLCVWPSTASGAPRGWPRALHCSDIWRAVSALPTVTPMAPTLAKPFHRPGCVYEEKYDGW